MPDNPGETRGEALARGQQEAWVDARLDSHDEHFARLNGSMGKFAVAVDGFSARLIELTHAFEMETEVRRAAAEALADETKRRREALVEEVQAVDRQAEASTRNWSKGQWAVGAAIPVVVAIIGYLLASGR